MIQYYLFGCRSTCKDINTMISMLLQPKIKKLFRKHEIKHDICKIVICDLYKNKNKSLKILSYSICLNFFCTVRLIRVERYLFFFKTVEQDLF